MVKKTLLILISTVWLSSCAFFGSSMFPVATSEKIGWFLNSGDARDFYILDNGAAEDDSLLILVMNDGGTTRVLILDTSLNIRGVMSPDNPDNPITTDGVGFVDHNGDYIIGQTKIGRNGSTDPGDVSVVPVPGMGINSDIIPYTDEMTLTNYYLRVEKTGLIWSYDEIWGTPLSNQIINYIDYIIINQDDQYYSDFTFARQAGDLYTYTKKQLYEHTTGATIPDLATTTPAISIVDSSLTQWVTRCSRGYFVSTNSGQYILYNYAGNVINSIENKNWSSGQVVTIDDDCQFYYVADRDKGIIRKERVPF